MASSAALDRNCAGMFVRCTSSTRSCSERRLSSRVVATLLAIVPLLLLEPTRRPLLSGLQAQRFQLRLEDNMTIIKGSDGSWTWNGAKEGAQRFDELAQAEALAKFDERRAGRGAWPQVAGGGAGSGGRQPKGRLGGRP